MALQSLFNHRKFTRVCRLLDVSRAQALGHLELLWRVGYETGNPVVGDAIDVEAAAEWDGRVGRFAEALADPTVRLLDTLADGRFAIHDLHENAPQYVRRKFLRHQARLAQRGDLAPVIDARPVTDRPVASQRSVTDQPLASPRGGERSRGERSGAEKSVSSVVAKPATPKPTAVPPEPALVTFPTAGAPSEWSFTQTQLTQWTTAYPGIDVLAEVRKALAWVQAQPHRKTASGMPRFLVSWLGRATDHPSTPQRSWGTTARTAGNPAAAAAFLNRAEK